MKKVYYQNDNFEYFSSIDLEEHEECCNCNIEVKNDEKVVNKDMYDGVEVLLCPYCGCEEFLVYKMIEDSKS